jgi:hypothetical protein
VYNLNVSTWRLRAIENRMVNQMSQQNPVTQTYSKGVLDLEGWPGEMRPNPEEAVEPGGLPDGPGGGIIEMLCALAAGQTAPVFVEPYAFLDTLREEKTAKYRAKHSPKWHRLIVEPAKVELARAFREESS